MASNCPRPRGQCKIAHIKGMMTHCLDQWLFNACALSWVSFRVSSECFHSLVLGLFSNNTGNHGNHTKLIGLQRRFLGHQGQSSCLPKQQKAACHVGWLWILFREIEPQGVLGRKNPEQSLMTTTASCDWMP